METNFRTWRVQPIKDGMKAPYHFVYTKKTKFKWEDEREANKLSQKCHLVKMGWDIILTEV